MCLKIHSRVRISFFAEGVRSEERLMRGMNNQLNNSFDCEENQWEFRAKNSLAAYDKHDLTRIMNSRTIGYCNKTMKNPKSGRRPL